MTERIEDKQIDEQLNNCQLDDKQQIDKWFEKIENKLLNYKERLKKEITWKKFKNRKKFKLLKLRKKLRRLDFRLHREPTDQNKVKTDELKAIDCKIKNEIKLIKQDLKCLYLVKRGFTANKLKEEIKLNQSKARSDENEFKQWRLSLRRALFGAKVLKLNKLTRQQRRTRNYYRCASINLSNLIRIRSLWDNYLDLSDSSGSSIPINYVLTDFEPNQQWKQYICK